MKRIILCLCLILGLASGAWADDDTVGFLTRLKTTPDEFFTLMKTSWATQGWTIVGGDHSTSKAKFFDSLMLMQMALNRGDIGEMILPDFVADYLLKFSSSYEVSCMSSSGRMGLCFGFMKGNELLAAKWNYALEYMRNNLTLSALEKKYIYDLKPEDEDYDYVYGMDDRRKKQKRKKERITFTQFPGAETIRVAITGDLPPVDYVNEEGLPAGYNIAVLSEIGKLMKVNIKTVSVNAGARTAALVSGRADVVFWYEVNKQNKFQPDVSDEVILSNPYLEWDTFKHLQFKE